MAAASNNFAYITDAYVQQEIQAIAELESAREQYQETIEESGLYMALGVLASSAGVASSRYGMLPEAVSFLFTWGGAGLCLGGITNRFAGWHQYRNIQQGRFQG